MNILMLNYEYPPIGSGSGIITRNISEGLAKLGNQITVITTAFGPEREGLKSLQTDPFLSGQQISVKVIRLKAHRKNNHHSNPLEMISWINATKTFLRQYQNIRQFDLCFAHFALPGGEVALWLKHQFNIPYVVMSHGHDIPWIHPGKMAFFHLVCYLKLRRICLESTVNFIQTTSMKANLDRFTGKYRSAKNIIIPNGINPEAFFPEYSKRPSRLKILFVGRLVSQKDPFTFMKALSLFKLHHPEFTVEILGDGPFRNRLQQYCRRHELNEIVKFRGKVSEGTMIHAFQSSQLVIATSLNEGMSISMIEGIACGCYIITTPVSGHEVLIQENVNGNVVRFRDPRGLCMVMQDFVETKFRDNYLIPVETINRMCDELNWEHISGKYQERLEYFFM